MDRVIETGCSTCHENSHTYIYDRVVINRCSLTAKYQSLEQDVRNIDVLTIVMLLPQLELQLVWLCIMVKLYLSSSNCTTIKKNESINVVTWEVQE